MVVERGGVRYPVALPGRIQPLGRVFPGAEGLIPIAASGPLGQTQSEVCQTRI